MAHPDLLVSAGTAPGPLPQARPLDGMRLFARFAYPPNRLGYCGGDVNAEILAYLQEDLADDGLRRHLRTFAAAYPYLQLIAWCNGIADPFDVRVVEAYWIGNDLLERVDWARYARHLHDRLRRQVRPAALELIVGKPSAGARAHHAFHVFDVSFRTGLPHGEAALDHCRIGWGTIIAAEPGGYTVSYRPIVVREGRMAYGEAQPVRVLRAIGDDAFMDNASAGDVIAFHWGWACVRLRSNQAAALERYTTAMMALANQTF